MKGLGATFTMEPAEMPGVIIAVLDDTCGNRIQIHQVVAPPAEPGQGGAS
jgi:predicted enzyme related to lactoylglutathione lyase